MDSTTFDVFAAMQEGKEPLARYTKTIVGKVHVTAIDPFSDKPVEVILEGPNNERKASIELWTNKYLLFFERVNYRHIQSGRLTKASTTTISEPISPNQLSDEEIDALLNDKFLALKARVEKFTDIAPVHRFIVRARTLDKSEKIIKFLEEKASQIEIEKYQ